MSDHDSNSLPKVLVSTTQRCGSSWVTSICYTILGLHNGSGLYVGGLKQGLLKLNDGGPERDAERVAEFSEVLRGHIAAGVRVFKTHDLPPRLFALFLEQNPDFHIINVIRDFRDVLISRLMYNRYYLPAMGIPLECAFVETHSELSDLELVRQFYGTAEMLDWLCMWKRFSEPVQHPRCLRLQYEEMLDNARLRETVELLGGILRPEGMSEAEIGRVIGACQFGESELNLKKDRKQREVKSDFCRKGVAGDFERFLTPHQSQVLSVLAS